MRGFIGQISHLGDMVPVMAGVTLSFRMRGEDRVGLVYVGDGATSTGAFHEGVNFAAVQRLPAGRDRREQRLRLLHPHAQAEPRQEFADKAVGYGCPATARTATICWPPTA